MNANLVSAAVSGIILAGLVGCATPAKTAMTDSASAATAPTGGDTAAAGAKHACKGQNECKAQGGCKTA